MLKLFIKTQLINLKQAKDYQQFYQQNEDWLKAYAAFSYLRDINQSANFMNWGKYATYSEDFLENVNFRK